MGADDFNSRCKSQIMVRFFKAHRPGIQKSSLSLPSSPTGDSFSIVASLWHKSYVAFDLGELEPESDPHDLEKTRRRGHDDLIVVCLEGTAIGRDSQLKIFPFTEEQRLLEGLESRRVIRSPAAGLDEGLPSVCRPCLCLVIQLFLTPHRSLAESISQLKCCLAALDQIYLWSLPRASVLILFDVFLRTERSPLWSHWNGFVLSEISHCFM
jgi:hypothetical protein